MKILNQTSPVDHNWWQDCHCPSCSTGKYTNYKGLLCQTR